MRFPEPLSALLQNELKGLGLADRLREADIWRVWPEVVGPAISSRARPLRIINGTLTVAVSSGPWMQELTFLKTMIREKLNTQLGGEVVRDIILKSGRVEKEPLPPVDEPPRKKRLTARQVALIAEQSAAIADPEIREAFAALMRASLESGR
ncbi:MAG TPA: DUF721 domain-containing protein [Desulfuromonadaceae bacterium]